MMQLIRNSSLERAIRQDSARHTLLVPLVACAVGATASAAVILALVDFATTQPSVPPISAQAIVRDVSAFQGTTAAQNRPVVETPRGLPATGMVSALDEPATQKEEERPSERHGQQLRKHGRILVHSRERDWRRRFGHNYSRSQHFSLW
jgi:hypothetical protein